MVFVKSDLNNLTWWVDSRDSMLLLWSVLKSAFWRAPFGLRNLEQNVFEISKFANNIERIYSEFLQG